MGRSRKRGHHRWVLSLANSALKWPFWGPVSLHDPKSKVAQVTVNDQESKWSRLAWITWITWHQLIWLLYPIIYRVSYMLGGWPWDFSSPSTWFNMTGPKKKHLGQFLFKLADPRIRSDSSWRDVYWEFVGWTCVLFTRCFFSECCWAFWWSFMSICFFENSHPYISFHEDILV